MPKASLTNPWLVTLQQHVESKPCVVLRLDESESDSLTESRHGFNEFTMARPRGLFSGIQTPTVCLIFGSRPGWMSPREVNPNTYLGIVSSCTPITTLDTRIKIKRAVRIEPRTEEALITLFGTRPQAKLLRKKLMSTTPVITLSAKLSSALIASLAAIPANEDPMRAVAASLHIPQRYTNFSAVQEDAVQTALRAFGLPTNARAEQIVLIDGKPTALVRVPLMEDSVIENDARSVTGYTLMSSDLTGRALFKKGNEKLEVFTANRRDLEHVFGVDLIYLNLTKKNIVMVQYKMLEPNRLQGEATDWLYRPEANMAKEIARMKRFAAQHEPGQSEYRFNPEVFYLKFVKRDGALSGGGIITPIDHYERLLADPASKGPRNAVRISYESLAGRYMRQGTFLELIQSGYIGAYAATTNYLSTLVQAVLKGDRAVIVAVQFSLAVDD